MPDHQHDCQMTNSNGTLIDSRTITYGSKELIFYATNILPQLLPCIDFIFTDQSN